MQVRHRQYLVEDVVPPTETNEASRIALAGLDDDNQGRRLGDLGRRMRRAHSHLLWVLHVVMALIVLLAYLVLRRSPRPLRALHEGVTRLSEGELDVAVPSRTRDEFGALGQAFNQMVGRISEMLRARDQLLLDVSHELRSPLTRVMVALALLPEGDKRRLAHGRRIEAANRSGRGAEVYGDAAALSPQGGRRLAPRSPRSVFTVDGVRLGGLAS
ncbi:MAG TPA: HAMP domain-containing protein [Thermoanaerobaculia bacterium]|nr:HAMP domain-containing protein [Thermoanaerobaculia bacterium]